jgi:enoyl-CoA hydratase/carnithine racemase
MADDAGMQQVVLFREVAAANGRRIGFAQLNAEKSLNALSLDMIRLLDPQLRLWADDPAIACVVLHGAGEKAFCAGGDVRSLRKAIVEYQGAPPNPGALAFFSEEYRLDHRIHSYPKPVLVWGGGIVMGGGLGLLAGASHRVVTETSRIAMPEISIGLFPDVGGSWFLRRMPGAMGLFVALTGVPLNAHDALEAGLANHFLRAADRDALFEALLAQDWQESSGGNRLLLSRLLNGYSGKAAELLPESNLRKQAAAIESLCAGNSLAGVVQRIGAYAGEDAWIRRGAATLAAGSPTTMALVWELRRRAATLSLAEVFRLELIVALQCCAHPDFAEGVRALLIDKDNKPQWQPATLDAVTPAWLDAHFAAPAWPLGAHPLADL